MVDITLHAILSEDIISSKNIDPSSIHQLLQKAIDNKLDVPNISSSQVTRMIKQKPDEKLSTFTTNRTASLWIKNLADLLQQHIAQRG